jgi:pimeloyl-ACP methyl ester carboxylesterase
MNYLEEITELGSGARRLDILVVPGIFEGSAYARAIAGRLKADAAAEGPSQRSLQEFSIRITSVLPPGYHPGDKEQGIIPDNDLYAYRLKAAYDSLPADSTKVVIGHSWGAATFLSRPLWDAEKNSGAPDLAISSAAAWSDFVGFSTRIAGVMLAIPLSQYPARFLTRTIGCKTLMQNALPEARAMVLGMPDLFSSRRVAYESYRRSLEGPCLCNHDQNSLRELLMGSGKKVTVVQGRKDYALNGPGILAALESIGDLDKLSENATILSGEFDHWPLLEETGLLGGILEGNLLQSPD